MLTALRRVLIPTFATLLLFASSAAAECAWVLWEQTTRPVQEWAIYEAHPTLRQCEAWLVDIASTMKQHGYDVPGMPSSPPGTGKWERRVLTFRKGNEAGSLMCLPDTVDPRGVKK